MKNRFSKDVRRETIPVISIFPCAALLILTLAPRAAAVAASPEDLGLIPQTVRLATGIDMHYVEKRGGKDRTVIFLHGYADSWRSFEHNLPLVSDDFHVFVLDLRGHGDSSKPACCYSQADFAADVIAFMDTRRIHKATLVGHSMGSLIAHKIAVDNPSRIDRLVLIGGAATAAGNEAILALEKFVEKLQEPIWKQILAGLLHEDHSAQLGKIAAPTLILWGDQDGIFPLGDQQRLNALIPDSTLKLYVPETLPEYASPDSTGHALHIEWPRRFVADLEAFVRKPQRTAERGRDLNQAKIYPSTGQQGTCYSSNCQACRNAGHTSAHDQCVNWVVGARYSYRVRYRYTGANEGHDGAANLLMWKGDGVHDVCNISKGTCCGWDSGCPLGIGHCSGSSSARVCTATQSCVGQFGPGGPMIDSGGATPLGFVGRLVGQYGGKPYDCDCTSGVEGSNGYFEIHVNANGGISAIAFGGPNEPNTGAGDIATQGWAYEVQTYKALACGTFYDSIGCLNQATRKIWHTNVEYRTASGGNPNFMIAESCY